MAFRIAVAIGKFVQYGDREALNDFSKRSDVCEECGTINPHSIHALTKEWIEVSFGCFFHCQLIVEHIVDGIFDRAHLSHSWLMTERTIFPWVCPRAARSCACCASARANVLSMATRITPVSSKPASCTSCAPLDRTCVVETVTPSFPASS